MISIIIIRSHHKYGTSPSVRAIELITNPKIPPDVAKPNRRMYESTSPNTLVESYSVNVPLNRRTIGFLASEPNSTIMASHAIPM